MLQLEARCDYVCEQQVGGVRDGVAATGLGTMYSGELLLGCLMDEVGCDIQVSY